MIDNLWQSGDYQTWLETKITKPTVGVHRAIVRWSDGVARDSHLKIVFMSDQPSRCFAHESAAWLLGKQLNLPVPAYAGFLILTAAQIAKAHPERPPGGDTVAWVTSTEPERHLLLTDRMENDRRVTEELKKWPLLTAACAFDEWLANVDRYPRNLLRRGPSDFSLIDHDFIAGGPHWLADILSEQTSDYFTNVLRDRCAPSSTGDPASERLFSNAMMHHAEAFPDAALAQIAEVTAWLERLIDNVNDRSAFLHFINERSKSSQNLISQRYKLLA